MTSVINEHENLLPPTPPTTEEISNGLRLINPNTLEQALPDTPVLVPQNDAPAEEEFIPGQFKYIEDDWTREMFVNAWQAITTTELWDFVKQPIDSFMFSGDPRVYTISRKMEQLGYTGHSGASFGCTMRTMQYIATHGEKKFREEHLANNQ